MGSPHQTAPCPVCGTRAIVDPKTKKVRAHLRKGGVTCDGRVEKPTGLARLVPPFVRRRRAANADAEAARVAGSAAEDATAGSGAKGSGEKGEDDAVPSGPVRIRVDCPVCGRFSAVDPEDIRIRIHKGGSGQKCAGSGTFPEMGALTIEGITIAEVRQRRRDAMAKRKPAGEEKKTRRLRLPGRKKDAPAGK